MIKIDTETLKQCSSAAANATANLNDAANIIRLIREHHDWECPNKEKINSYIATNQSLITELVADAQKFNTVIQDVTDRYTEEESKISMLFEEVEEMLSGFLNIATLATGTVSSVGSGFVSQAASAIASISVAGAEALAGSLSGDGE